MFKDLITKDLKDTLDMLGYQIPSDTLLSIPENPEFGDYTTNIPLQLANQKSKKHYQPPREIANKILEKLGHPVYLQRIEIAGSGFINFFLKDESLLLMIIGGKLPGDTQYATRDKPKKYLVEYSQPNTHKAFHIGHLRNLIIGESIARSLEYEGHEVFRVTYGSDIGLPVSKALWGIGRLGEELDQARRGSLSEKIDFLGKAYVIGAKAYDEDPKIKDEINQITNDLYQRKSKLQDLWEETKKWSIVYLDSIYSKLGVEFDREIWESEIEAEGKKIVEQNIGKIFIEDQGAIIFPGERFKLHNRVFINRAGNPTYEAKELGVTRLEEELFPFDYALHIVGNEQEGYFKVVIKVVELIEERLKGRKKHIAYGMVNLTTGKMSSREGNVVSGEQLIDQVKEEITKIVEGSHLPSKQQLIEKIALAAIKFSMLKYSRTKDIAFDIEQSVSLKGDSGPYLLYTYARISSLLENAKRLKAKSELTFDKKLWKLEPEERQILRLLEYFEVVIQNVSLSLEPNELCDYLIDLTKAFNLFYQKYPVLGSKEEGLRLSLVKKVGENLKLGLYLLGIETVERM